MKRFGSKDHIEKSHLNKIMIVFISFQLRFHCIVRMDRNHGSISKCFFLFLCISVGRQRLHGKNINQLVTIIYLIL